MKTNEIKSNLKKIITEAQIFETEHQDENVQYIILCITDMAGQIPYEHLQEVYSEGFELFRKSKNWKNYSEGNVFHVLMAFASALITEYGLSIKEYLQWSECQKTMFDPYLVELVGGHVEKKQKESLLNYFYLEKVQMLMAPSDIANGVKLSSGTVGGKHEFKIIDQYIEFSEDFDRYFKIDSQLNQIVKSVEIQFVNKYNLIFNDFNNFNEKLTSLNEDTMKDFHLRILKLLRSYNVESKDIQGFSDNFRRFVKQQSCTAVVELFAEFLQQGAGEMDGDYELNLDNEYTRTIDAFFRGMPTNHDAQGLAVDITRRYALNAAKGAAGATIRGLWGMVQKKAIEVQIKHILKSEGFIDQFRLLFSGIMNVFREEIFKSLNLKDYDLRYDRVDRCIIKNVIDSYFGRLNVVMTEADRKEILLGWAQNCPFDPVIYSTIYALYGKGGGETGQIAEYLGISKPYNEDTGKYIEKTAEKSYNLPNASLQQIEVKLQKLEDFEEKYGYEGKSAGVKQLKEMHQMLSEWKKLYEKIPAIKAEADKAFVELDDQYLWSQGEAGDTYVQYLLLRYYLHLALPQKAVNENIMKFLKVILDKGYQLAGYIYAYIMRSAADGSAAKMWDGNIRMYADKRIIAAVCENGRMLVNEGTWVKGEECIQGYGYICEAEKERYPYAFIEHCCLSLSGLDVGKECIVEKNVLVAEGLYGIARAFGIENLKIEEKITKERGVQFCKEEVGSGQTVSFADLLDERNKNAVIIQTEQEAKRKEEAEREQEAKRKEEEQREQEAKRKEEEQREQEAKRKEEAEREQEVKRKEEQREQEAKRKEEEQREQEAERKAEEQREQEAKRKEVDQGEQEYKGKTKEQQEQEAKRKLEEQWRKHINQEEGRVQEAQTLMKSDRQVSLKMETSKQKPAKAIGSPSSKKEKTTIVLLIAAPFLTPTPFALIGIVMEIVGIVFWRQLTKGVVKHKKILKILGILNCVWLVCIVLILTAAICSLF